jgi:hypothetical protein
MLAARFENVTSPSWEIVMLQKSARVIVPLLFGLLAVALWMNNRDRQARIDQLQTSIEKLQQEIDKTRTQIEQRNETQQQKQ